MSPRRLERLALLRVTLRSALELCAADLADVHTPGKSLPLRGEVATLWLGFVQGVLTSVERELEREQQRAGGGR